MRRSAGGDGVVGRVQVITVYHMAPIATEVAACFLTVSALTPLAFLGSGINEQGSNGTIISAGSLRGLAAAVC